MKTEYYMNGSEIQELRTWTVNHKGIIPRTMQIIGNIRDPRRGEHICKVLTAHEKIEEAKEIRIRKKIDERIMRENG